MSFFSLTNLLRLIRFGASKPTQPVMNPLANSYSHIEMQRDYLHYWFEDLQNNPSEFLQPILNEAVLDKIKLFCDSLHQDAHVFHATVDTLEKYVRIKERNMREIEDPLLVAITIIYMHGKLVGELSEFKMENLILLYERMTANTTSNQAIKYTEIEILQTINYNLPLHSKIDDLKMFFLYYVEPMNLNIDLLPLAEELLTLYVIHSLNIFNFLQLTYLKSKDALEAFVCIYTNKLYIPIVIILCAFLIIHANRVIDVKHYTKDLSKKCNIHLDHLQLLSNHLYSIYVHKGRVNKIHKIKS